MFGVWGLGFVVVVWNLFDALEVAFALHGGDGDIIDKVLVQVSYPHPRQLVPLEYSYYGEACNESGTTLSA